MTPLPIDRVGRYRLEEIVGTGSFASVYRARDERLDAPVVVKILGDNHGLNPDIRARFIAEGRALRKVHSPNVIQIYDAGETDRNQPYLVLEHADRGTLGRRMTELHGTAARITPVDVAAVARSLGVAVAAVHEAGLIHRDLSPSNVLLRSVVASSGNGRHGPVRGGAQGLLGAPVAPAGTIIRHDERLVVADLGLCKDLAINSGITVGGGTDGFRPPEQRERPGQVDNRADLWALSALMIWMVSGRNPLETDASEAVAAAGLPGGLAGALSRSLADAPDDRHADVDEWLTDVLASLDDATSEASGAGTAGSSRRRRWPRHRWLIAMFIALLVGAAAGAGLAARATRSSGPEITDAGAGLVEVSRTVGDARLAVRGPESIVAGEAATFEASSEGVDQLVWLMPDGSVLTDVATVTIETRSAGRAPVTLRGRLEGSWGLEVTHELRVVDGE